MPLGIADRTSGIGSLKSLKGADSTVVYDSFDRPDGALGTADTGQAWVVANGTSVISGGEAQSNTTNAVAYVESGLTDCIVSANLRNTGRSGLMFRYNNSTDYWYLLAVGTNFYVVCHITDGNAGGGAISGVVPGDYDFCEIIMQGTQVTIKINGVIQKVLNGSYITLNNGGTKHGMTRSDAVGTIDNFRVKKLETFEDANVPFDPLTLPGLVAWYDAATSFGSAINGQAITIWPDLGPNHYDMTGTASIQTAAQNILPAVKFNGVSDFLTTGAFATAQSSPITIFLIVSDDRTKNISFYYDGTIGQRITYYREGTAYMHVSVGSVGSNFIVNAGAPNANITTLYTFVYDLNNSAAYVNNKLDALTQSLTAANISDFRLGARYDQYAGYLLSGFICTFGVVAGHLSPEKINQVNRYLTKRWFDFDPRKLPGASSFYDASTITGFTDGQALTTWSDGSGLGNNVRQAGANSLAVPTFKTNIQNGNPAVFFTNNSLQLDTIQDFPNGQTIYLVIKMTTGRPSGYSVLYINKQILITTLPASDGFGVYTNGSYGNTPSLTTAGWIVLTVTSPDSSHLSLSTNGAEVYANTGFAWGNSNRQTIGSNEGDTGGQSWQGYIGEIRTFGQAHSPTDQAKMVSYLRTKWGI